MAEALGTCQIMRNLLATASPTQCVQPFELLPRAGPRQTEHKQQHCVSQFVSRIATIVCEFVNFLSTTLGARICKTLQAHTDAFRTPKIV